MSFGENLKKIRTNRNITQQQLADYLNVTRPTIAGYETKGKEPDFKTLIMISQYFDVSIDYLIKGSIYQYDPTSISSCLKDNQDILYSGYAIMPHTLQPSDIVILVENIISLEPLDFKRLMDYLNLLLNQPVYKKKGLPL